MLQSSCLPFVLYASQRIACYFCTMKRFLLITIAAIFCSSQQYALSSIPSHRLKVHRKAVPKTTQSATSEQLPPCSPHQRRELSALPHYKPKRSRPTATRHLSVHSVISLSPALSATADPFTKKKSPTQRADLKANYEPTYAMMHGEVIKVGKDKRSGLYVTPPSRRLHRQLLPPLPNSRHQRHPRPSGIIIALTGNSGRSTGPHLHLTLKDTKRTSHRPVHSSPILSSIHSNRTPCLLSFTSPLPHCNNVLNI